MGKSLKPPTLLEHQPVFPDAPHVAALGRALWTEREFGRAAVMVGAGMSRNAIPRHPGQPSMPMWWELTNALIDRLYPEGSGSERRRNRLLATAASISVSTRLADEYAVAFGRHELDSLIRTLVPDSDFTPGPLHEQLLRLPWADVLTTNWDTLLERAAESVTGRRYSAVRRPEEIPTSSRPRIVKLHGSFPANGPFVFTEEDFRTYPRRHAPFVNLVRQSALENTLCLIGFSGDDPNFLAWSGWVRDELAEYAPRIYLCGVLGLTHPERALLGRRGVIPIDLSPIVPRDRFPDHAIRHAKALEWFLRRLASARPYDPLRWPSPPAPTQPGTTDRLDVRAPRVEPRYPSDIGKDAASSESDRLAALAATWEHNRACYPGWLVAPASIRESVFGNTKHWITDILAHLPQLAPIRSITILSELMWRLDLCLVPLSNDLASAGETAVTAFNPFPQLVADLPGTAITPSSDSGRALDWGVLGRVWVGMAFELLRWYREERMDEQFAVWSDRFARLDSLSHDDRCRWCYEGCLHALGQMEDARVRSALKAWPDDSQDPMWLVRKAGIAAELGDLHDGLRAVTTALSGLRSGLTDTQSHLFALSREGWAMSLARNIEYAANHFSHDRRGAEEPSTLWERFAQLRQFECDPWQFGEWFGARISGRPPTQESGDAVRVGFEPNTAIRTLSFGGSNSVELLLPAYQCLRLSEVTGTPPAIPGMSFAPELLASIARWFADIDPVRTQSAAFRRLDKKLVEEYLTRSRVALLEADQVREWIAMTTRVIGEALPNIGVGFRPSTPHERRTRDRLQQALEIVSRLAARATESECETQWALLGHLHTIPILRILHLEGSLRQWARSLAHATPVANLSAKFAGLLALPMAGEPTFPVLNPYDWPDPVLSLDDRLGRFAKQVTGAALRNAIQKATTIVRGADVPPRRAGLLRMYVLRRHGLLAPDEVWDACAAFWETIQDDPAKAVGVYGPDALRISLQFLSAADTERVARVMAYILDWKPGAVVGGMVNPDELLLLIVATAPRRIRTRAGGVRFRWTAAELVAIFNKLRDWWRTFGSDAVAKPARGGMELFDAPVLDSFISGLLDVLRILLLPSARKSGRFGRDLVQFVEELRQAKVLVGSVLPATLLVRDVADGAAVTSVLRHDLASREPDRQISALRGLISWVSLARDHTQAGRRQLPDIPLDLIREVGTQIAVRRPRVLRWGLQCARELLLLLGPSADGQFLSGLFIALDYLAAELRYGEDGPSGGEISADDVPQLRAEVAQVAKVLADLGHGSAPSVASWIEAARNDPLPEVREAVTLDEDAPPVD